MVSQENVQILLVKEPLGRRVEASDFEVAKTPFTTPEPLEPGTLVVRNLYLSMDPYMRGRMNTSIKKSYFPPFELGKVMQTQVVAEVIAGERDGISVGDKVLGMGEWSLYSVFPPTARIHKVDPNAPFSPTLLLGTLGVTGATAYHGLSLCAPKSGETIFVSGAAGAVGLAVAQLAKIQGLKVIGSAGTDEKVQLLKEKYGFDEVFNYRTHQGKIQETLQALAPNGIDCYFDNVGAEHLDAALGCMNNHGRVAVCGAISTYNGESYSYRNLMLIVGKRLKIQGFIISDQLQDPEFMGKFSGDMATWLAEGKVAAPEHIVEGIEKAPEAFLGLFSGTNFGKMIVKV